jgi:hypothetical protein
MVSRRTVLKYVRKLPTPSYKGELSESEELLFKKRWYFEAELKKARRLAFVRARERIRFHKKTRTFLLNCRSQVKRLAEGKIEQYAVALLFINNPNELLQAVRHPFKFINKLKRIKPDYIYQKVYPPEFLTSLSKAVKQPLFLSFRKRPAI